MRGRVVLGVSVFVLAGGLLASAAPAEQAVLEPPTWIDAAYVSSAKAVDLRWSPVPGAVAYNVFRSESPGKDHALIGTVPGARYLDKSVEPGTTYYYRVTFLTSGFMESPPSEERSVGGGASDETGAPGPRAPQP